MSKNHAFVAKLWLDLDSGLVDLHLRPNTVRCMDIVHRLHGTGSFGLVSLGRFILTLHRGDSPAALAILPAYQKVGGEAWRLSDSVYKLFTRGNGIEGIIAGSVLDNTAFRSASRGPVLQKAAAPVTYAIPLSKGVVEMMVLTPQELGGKTEIR